MRNRRFTQEYKLQVLDEIDQCKHGQKKDILAKEKLTSTDISRWREEFNRSKLFSISDKSLKKKYENILNDINRQIEKLDNELQHLKRIRNNTIKCLSVINED